MAEPGSTLLWSLAAVARFHPSLGDFTQYSQAEFLETVAQRVAADAESLGGFRLIAAGFAQGLFDQRAFPLGQLDTIRRQRRHVALSRGSSIVTLFSTSAAWRVHRAHEREVACLQRAALIPEHGSLDDVTQFAHVPRPRIREQGFARLGIDAAHLLPVFGGEPREKSIREEQHVLASFAQ